MGASAFPKIYALGKVEIQDIFKTEVEVTEKIDGSQFTFGLDETGNLVFRSKGKEMFFEAHEKMFNKAVEYLIAYENTIKTALTSGMYVCAEYLQKPKHNVVAYERVPHNNLIVFGVREAGNYWTAYDEIDMLATTLGLETVPLLYKGTIDMTRVDKENGGYSYVGYDFLKRILETRISILGGEFGIEGIVAKNYEQRTKFGDPTICCGKYVRESFKERHQKEWKTGGDTVREFIESFRTEARWQKAVNHLREKVELENDPRDIGKLMKEINIDIEKEEEEEIKNFFYKHFIKEIKRKATAGAPEWYKEQLLKKAFEPVEEKKNV